MAFAPFGRSGHRAATHRATAFTPPDAIVPSRSQSTRVLHIDT